MVYFKQFETEEQIEKGGKRLSRYIGAINKTPSVTRLHPAVPVYIVPPIALKLLGVHQVVI